MVLGVIKTGQYDSCQVPGLMGMKVERGLKPESCVQFLLHRLASNSVRRVPDQSTSQNKTAIRLYLWSKGRALAQSCSSAPFLHGPS